MGATDVNADGTILTIADFTYLLRLVQGNADPFPVVDPADSPDVYYSHRDGILSLESSVGSIYVVAAGDIEPTNFSEYNMRYNYDATTGTTRTPNRSLR